MTNTTPPHALSATRGNSFGIGFFRLLLKFGGINRACEFVWFIALFYALFDHKARRSTTPYLRHRFPNAGLFRLWCYAYRLMVSQGQSLLEAAAANIGTEYSICSENDSELRDLIFKSKRGIILLISHFGPWQASMSTILNYGRNVTIVVQRDQNVNVDKMMAVKKNGLKINTVFTDDFTGGIFDAMSAIEHGDIVCIMGDRCREKDAVQIDFLGEAARFPFAAFYLAAKCECPVVPMFVFRENSHESLLFHFGKSLHPECHVRSRHRRESLRPYVTAYVAELESASRRFPFQCYIFENIWVKIKLEIE
jgi:predicted LPLAT superfamily acyltransferase